MAIVASRWRVIALVLQFLSVTSSLPQKRTGKLEVSGENHDRVVLEVSEKGVASALVSPDDVRSGSHMRRETTDGTRRSAALNERGLVEEPQVDSSEHPTILPAEKAEERLEEDGIVDTYEAATGASQMIKLEEETIECMMDSPVWLCMQKHGSYGVRRLFTDREEDHDKLHNWRKDWMSHPEVQKKTLFNITWPGSHDSGAYGFEPDGRLQNDTETNSAKSAFTQSHDVYAQLGLGVRAIDLQVVVSKVDGELYTASGHIMMPLAKVLTDIASFLEAHGNEVVILHMRKADVRSAIDEDHVKPLKEEDSNYHTIPGESVHKGVHAIFGSHLATYDSLKALPSEESKDNPSIRAAVESGIRVFYFWEGQQVLCIDKKSCSKTPGWFPSPPGQDLPFGPGMPLGDRAQRVRGISGETVVEPACTHNSSSTFASSNPYELILDLKHYASALMDAVKYHPAKCFPKNTSIPGLHTPTLLYKAEAYLPPYSESEAEYRQQYRDIQELYTRGEKATAKSEAERINFLTLNWLLRQKWRPLFSKLNIISMDHVSPINIHRLVEANQNRKDCGYAIHCKSTGSCWAQTLLDDEHDTCRNEDAVTAFLKEHSDGDPAPMWLWILGLIAACIAVKACCATGICYAVGNNPCPTCCFEDGVGIVWRKRQKKPESQESTPFTTAEETPPEAAAVAEEQPSQEGMSNEQQPSQDQDPDDF